MPIPPLAAASGGGSLACSQPARTAIDETVLFTWRCALARQPPGPLLSLRVLILIACAIAEAFYARAGAIPSQPRCPSMLTARLQPSLQHQPHQHMQNGHLAAKVPSPLADTILQAWMPSPLTRACIARCAPARLEMTNWHWPRTAAASPADCTG